jgi:hypothetical protein
MTGSDEYLVVSKWHDRWWLHEHRHSDHCSEHGTRLAEGERAEMEALAAARGLPVEVIDYDAEDELRLS